jgi:nitric oxide reductase NorQ protein
MTETYYATGNEVQLFEQAYHQRLPVMLDRKSVV